MTYHLVPYNFEDYDFVKLWEEETNNDGEVFWRHKSKTYGFSKNDICYFYCTNLPDMTRRILLKAIISDANCKDVEGNKCFKTKNISSIRLNEQQNNPEDYFYSLERLKDFYGIGCVRGKQRIVPELEADNSELLEKRKLLLDNLEKEPSTGDLLTVKNYFSKMTKCIFQGKTHQFDINKTFYKPNGFLYYEIHHVLHQSLQKSTKKNKELLRKHIVLKDIEDLKNKVYICPVCHRQLHSGQISVVREMIEYLYTQDDKRKAFYDKCFLEYANKDSYKDTLGWLYAIYNVENKSLKKR